MQRKRASQNFKTKIFFVPETVRSALNDSDFVVQSLNKTKGDLVFGPAVGSNTVPMTVYHLGELLLVFQALPFQLPAPVLEELSRPGFAAVIPELTEGLLEQIGNVQPLVAREQELKVLAGGTGEILPVREQGVFLSLDKLPVLALQASVLFRSGFIDRLTQVVDDVKLVIENRRPRGMPGGGIMKCLPHVHHGQADLFGLLFPEKSVELIHALLRAIFPTEPDRAALLQIADHDTVVVPLANRDLVDADHFGVGRARAFELPAHVLFVELLRRVPAQAQLFGNILHRGLRAAPAAVAGKAGRGVRVLAQQCQALAFHRTALAAVKPPHLHVEVNAKLPTRQISYPPACAIVPAPMPLPADPAECFFSRLRSVTRRARASPKRPCTVAAVRNPGNVSASASRRRLRGVAMRPSCQKS